MILKGKDGIQYNLEAIPFAQGGEGKIFNIQGHPDKVAKIYREGKINRELEEKLTYMCQNQPDSSVVKRLAWPIDILLENKRFVGFVMPRFGQTKDLQDAYEIPNYTELSFLKRICIAKNLCVIVDELHRLGYVCGDMNSRNIKYEPDTGYVVFVDADSYHIMTSNYEFRCKVVRPEYAPRELQLKMSGGLATADLPTFTKHTDDFSLAVHIFQLLMSGYHPFGAAHKKVDGYETSIDIAEPETYIAIGFSPYFHEHRELDRAKYSPKITDLPRKLTDLFRAAFIDGHNDPTARPTAERWYYALDELSRNLVRCNQEPKHEYSNHLTACPWCALTKVSVAKNSTIEDWLFDTKKTFTKLPEDACLDVFTWSADEVQDDAKTTQNNSNVKLMPVDW